MIVPLLFACTVTATTSARALSVEPLPFVVLTPGEPPKVLSTAKVRAELERVFVPRTALDPRAEEDPAFADCRGRVECIEARVSTPARYLLVLTVLPSRDAKLDFVSVVFRDHTKSALQEAHLQVEDARELGEHLQGLVAPEAWGAIAIENLPAGALVELDGVVLGSFTHIEHVRPGEHPIKAGSHEARVIVAGGRTTSLRVETQLPIGVRIGGGTAIAGAALTIAGLFVPSIETHCFEGIECGGARLARTGSGSSSVFGDPNGRGLSLFQLGASLLGAGVACGLMSWLHDEQWLAYVAGAVAGAAIFLTFTAADGAPRTE